VIGANAVNGIDIVQGNGGGVGQQRNLAGIDLGTGGGTPSYGLNWVQMPVGGLGRNQVTGLCINLGGAASGAATLNAAGNEMVFGTGVGTQVNCATTAQTVTKGPTCTGGASLGIAVHQFWKAKGDEYNRNPVGTGPFVLKSWTAGDRMILEKNPALLRHAEIFPLCIFTSGHKRLIDR